MWLNGKPRFTSCCCLHQWPLGCCFSWQKPLCFQKKGRTPNNLDIFSIYPDPHSGIYKSRLCFRLLFLPSFSFYEDLQSNRNPSLAVSHFQRTFLPLPCSERSLSPFFGICATSCHFSPGYFFVWLVFHFFFSVSLLLFNILLLLFCLLSSCHLPLPFWTSSLLPPTRRAGPTRSGCQTFQLWGWRVSSISGQPSPVSDYPHHGIFLPCI